MRASIGKRFVNAQLREQNLSRRGCIIVAALHKKTADRCITGRPALAEASAS
jgi:hypothetical protein